MNPGILLPLQNPGVIKSESQECKTKEMVFNTGC